ncbi:MAG: hypothetical protein AAFO03_25350 [Bacteroidota bacterium]
MNVFALKGHKIIVTIKGLKSGYELDKSKAQKYLQIGQEYTVEKTDVSRSSSRVWLKEIPDEIFNTVHFEDVRHQDIAEDRKHPDFQKLVKVGIIRDE